MQNVIEFYTCDGCLLMEQKYISSVGLGVARTLTFSFTPIAEASRTATVLQVHYNYYKTTFYRIPFTGKDEQKWRLFGRLDRPRSYRVSILLQLL